MIPRPENPLIAALDTSRLEDAGRLASILAPHVGMLKVGLELFWAHGPQAVASIAEKAPVFVDSKLHDIPNTVERASANIARLGPAMLNVHALGGPAMMRAALEGARRGAQEAGVPAPMVIAVTVLSSMRGEDLVPATSLAWEAFDAGLDGVVVSGEDVEEVRGVCGDRFCLVVPGIRPAGTDGDDQVRVLEPAEAMAKGADYLVVGRPITGAADPAAVARSILLDCR